MGQVTVSVKTEQQVKEEFSRFCDEIGLNMSSAINLFMRTVLREQRIPFEICLPVPNAETMRVIEEAEKGINLSRTFDSVEELMEELNA